MGRGIIIHRDQMLTRAKGTWKAQLSWAKALSGHTCLIRPIPAPERPMCKGLSCSTLYVRELTRPLQAWLWPCSNLVVWNGLQLLRKMCIGGAISWGDSRQAPHQRKASKQCVWYNPMLTQKMFRFVQAKCSPAHVEYFLCSWKLPQKILGQPWME